MDTSEDSILPTNPDLATPELSQSPSLASTAASQQTSQDDSQKEPAKVLFVDDNPITRAVISHLLQSEGIICETATSGQEAISKIFNGSATPPALSLDEIQRASSTTDDMQSTTSTSTTTATDTAPRYPFHLVLMDINMPEMNGFQAVQKIRDQEAALAGPNRRIPIVAISADAGISLAECLSRGMDGLCNLGGTGSFQEVLMTVVRHWLQTYRKSPRKTPQTEEGEKAAVVPKTEVSTSSPKILIVEDNVINQQVVCKFLEKSGYPNFDIACDGKEASECFTNFNYRLILMDCQMPVMDGYEATMKIRETEAKDKRTAVPIIAMTAHAMSTDKEKCLECGMTDYLMKPIQRVVLIEMLHKYLNDRPKAAGK